MLVRIASRLPPHPNLYTLSGLAATLLGATMFTEGWVIAGIMLVVIGGLLDALDGAVARVHGLVSRAGGFLDSLSDRVSDAAITYSFTRFAPPWLVAYLIAATLIYSYARARAEAALCRKLEGVGLLERGERLPAQVAVMMVYAVFGGAAALYTLYAYTLLVTLALLHRAARLYSLLARMG